MLLVQNVSLFQEEIVKRIGQSDWTWEEACEMGLAARNMRDLSNWIIGTVALGIEIKWGENRLNDFANLLGFSRKTIEQYRWVVQKFGEDYKPLEGYPWSYYRLAAGTEDPKETIKEMIDKDMSFGDAERYVKGIPLRQECQHEFETVSFEKCKLCKMLKPKDL